MRTGEYGDHTPLFQSKFSMDRSAVCALSESCPESLFMSVALPRISQNCRLSKCNLIYVPHKGNLA